MPHKPRSQEEPSAEQLSSLDVERLASRRILDVALALILAAPAAIWLLQSPSDTEGAIGVTRIDEAAPDFTLDLFDDTRFTLSEHLVRDGRPVVMNFWASWCVPCRVEMPAFDAVARRHPEVLFLGVAMQDTEAAVRQFAAEVAVSYPLGLDTDGGIARLYPILGLPTTWFIAADGTIVAQYAGQLHDDSLESLIEEHLSG